MKSIDHKWLFAQDCRFVIGANKFSDIPDSKIAEIAFVGLSNVGKSSLINALTGRKALARTSNTPGRTKQINLFLLAEKLMLADLPGYGYAKTSKKEKESWTRLIKGYLKGRPNLRRVCILIDSRRGIKDSDREMMLLMDEAAVSYQIVLTKIDKLKKSELEKIELDISNLQKKHTALYHEIILTSAEKKKGIEELREVIAGFAG